MLTANDFGFKTWQFLKIEYDRFEFNKNSLILISRERDNQLLHFWQVNIKKM
jgi:hypothetical protein